MPIPQGRRPYHIGNMPWPKGKPKDPQTREKLRQARLGKIASEEAKANISRGITTFWAEFKASGRKKRGKGKGVSAERKRAGYAAQDAQAPLQEPVGVVQESA
jgi:hypothetical protein